MSEEEQTPVEEETPKPEREIVSQPTGFWARAKARFLPSWPSSRRLPVSATFVRWTLIVLGAVAIMGSAGVAYATYDYHREYQGRILPGAWVAGVNVGGLTQDEAEDVVDAVLAPSLDGRLTLTWDDKKWAVTPRELGAKTRSEQLVAAAARASSEASFLDKAKMSVLGEESWFEANDAIRFPRKPMMAFVRGLAASFNRKPRPESIDYSTGWIKLKPALEGRELLVKKTFRALRAGVESGTAEAAVDVRKAPKSDPDRYDQILLLRIGENKLYLYEDGKITKEYTVATGQPEYPTPTGEYEVTEKRYMPTWVNPDPEGWGASMPLSIPPGPGNPLGLRALNWSAPAIRFHGTSATYSLGYNASHGCVRMANEDVIELYDTVDVGTPIISTVVAPLKPMYVSAPDPTVVAEDGSDAAGAGERDGGDDRSGDSGSDGPAGQRKKN